LVGTLGGGDEVVAFVSVVVVLSVVEPCWLSWLVQDVIQKNNNANNGIRRKFEDFMVVGLIMKNEGRRK
jgi:hypothetical protein